MKGVDSFLRNGVDCATPGNTQQLTPAAIGSRLAVSVVFCASAVSHNTQDGRSTVCGADGSCG